MGAKIVCKTLPFGCLEMFGWFGKKKTLLSPKRRCKKYKRAINQSMIHYVLNLLSLLLNSIYYIVISTFEVACQYKEWFSQGLSPYLILVRELHLTLNGSAEVECYSQGEKHCMQQLFFGTSCYLLTLYPILLYRPVSLTNYRQLIQIKVIDSTTSTVCRNTKTFNY